MCHRTINYMADMMEKKFGIPWIKVNFIGAEGTAKSLRKIAQYFDDAELTAQVERVIKDEMRAVRAARDEVKARCEGKTAMLFVGGSRAHHYQNLFTEIGMKTVAAGYEFGHRDDYEGRKVLPTIKLDADTKNIEELTVTADETRYNPRRTPEQMKQFAENTEEVADYIGMMPDMEDGQLVVDDISHYETERLLEIYKPSIFCAGIKEKFVVEKMGIPCKQLHNYDYSGPYAGFKGAITFYRDIDEMVNTKVWSFLEAPWQKPEQPAGVVSAG
jgi:nitrogenase molybdenum-iron protein alpha chain